ncbi:ABC transporter ATP-binding protein [Kineosporia sp. A_224]|uniref:ABC transporter ATP-binding protein n=1 Tax=Kineosporia sp. A_224 TaxID=1962180 RepID=UPI000B4C180B|nr:ABC transporter ATP-binding protein [Kineosporia sp. A_224]
MAVPVLALRGVTRVFDGGAGVHAVDLEVRPGEVVALVGLNGAGKTTLLRLVLGMLRPHTGSVELDGVPLDRLPAVAWAGVGAQIEYPLAYPELDGATNLALAARLHGVPRADVGATVAAVLDELDLGRYARVLARRMSLGNRQRLGLAVALQHHPRLVVLDEPTNALDPRGILLVRAAVRRRADAGAAVLVSSHHLDEVARVADRILVIGDGRMIGTLDPHGAELERAFFALVHDDALSRAS